MAGKVFISCGQRPGRERNIANRVRDLLRDEFSLSPYLAFRIQSLQDIMTITNELRSSDYFIFIDFLREPEKPQDVPISLFTHQELALAHHLGFQDMIALQQEDVPREGFLNYVLSNPATFIDEEDLIQKVRALVEERGWTSDYSRNLVISEEGFTGPWEYTDHTGTFLEYVWQLVVENRRPDAAAVGTVCILDYILDENGVRTNSPDRSYLKWAGQSGYERTILPQDYGIVDLFSIRATAQGIFLHSLRDTPREPILVENGQYELFYKLFSQGFPLVEFSVRVNLNWNPLSQLSWENRSSANLGQ